jgi:hypothetical protein
MWMLMTVALLLLAASPAFAQNAGGQTELPIQREKGQTVSVATKGKLTEMTKQPTPLAFNEFFDARVTSELRPSAKLSGLNGKRVRIIGFMAQMELPPKGAFYLVPRPVVCDEAGGGTADLPPENVLVIVPSLRGKIIDFTPWLLEATGILEIGNKTDADGRVSAIRLFLDSTRESSANQTSGNQTSTNNRTSAKH